MSNPGSVAFPLLKLGLTRHGPCDEWFVDRGKMHQIDDARRLDDTRFDVPPRCPSTGPQTFAANMAFVGFGGSCFGNTHDVKMIDAVEKCESLASSCITGSLLSDLSSSQAARDTELLALRFVTQRFRSRADHLVSVRSQPRRYSLPVASVLLCPGLEQSTVFAPATMPA